MPRQTIDREDWAEAALSALGEAGWEAVAIEPLARRLGVTKGSFYWHFRDRGALIDAVLERWEAQRTGEIIEGLSAVADPRDRLARLFVAASRLDSPGRASYLALAAAHRVPAVAAVLDRVTARRLAFVAAAYREIGFESRVARKRALLAYSAYVGLLHLAGEAPAQLPHGRDFAAYVSHLVATLVPKKTRAGG